MPSAARPAAEGLQRVRIVRAVADVVAERGVAAASVELVIARAQVSRRTFHKHFADLPEAVIAVLEHCYRQAASLAANAFAAEGTWVQGMRSALAATLAFFDSEPEFARVCLVEAPAGDRAVRDHLEARVTVYRAQFVARLQDEVSSASPLAPEGVLASVMGVVRARLIAPEAGPLIELLGPLMGVIVAPFMPEAEIAQEVAAGNALARALPPGRPTPDAAGLARGALAHVAIPLPLTHPSAFRLRECLRYVAAHPGASNSQVAAGVGISHRGQTALLLRRLVSLGLLAKDAGAPGHANAWQATAAGYAVARVLNRESAHPDDM